MKSNLFKIAFAGLFVFALPALADSKSEPSKEVQLAAAENALQETPPASPAKDPHAGHNHVAEKPAVKSLDTRTQIAQEQSKLEAAIKAGELAKVQPLAFGIRDLAVALAAKTTGPKAAESKKLVDGIKVSADKLGEYGKKGDAQGVTKEYATFKKELQSLATTTPQQTPPAVTDPQAGHDHGEKKAEQPSATSHEIWAQIAAKQAQLEAVMQAGDLAKVHVLAFAIRDHVVALEAKTETSNAAERDKIVDEIYTSAGKLDEYGDSGNASAVKEEYRKFQQQLQALRALYDGK